ncbi:hypothetical protein ILUMI_22408 [Ignelater luminosus]|uniref:Peptidase S1 domain-containing protein n=1 Tax=Ignelater luminosus TaxID=2038154 RepID=A0A8K0CAP7_IGNLU|nr:hypothetical protein ILUMI_22408 [Ignelater luminosus]
MAPLMLLIFTVTIANSFGKLHASLESTDFPTSDDIATRMVGGTDAPEGSFPYQVSLRRIERLRHSCGGSIIAPTVILTAAHCVRQYDHPSEVLVVAGSHKLSSGGDVYGVKHLKVHEKYNFWTIENDIGLIILNRSIQYSEFVRPIELETRFIGVGVHVVLCGWGQTSYRGNFSDHLQYLNTKVVSNAECQIAFTKTPLYTPIFDTEMCTLTREGEGFCKTDSGGPLVAETNQKQVGIISLSEPCALGVPDVYTRVSFYIEWIARNSEA